MFDNLPFSFIPDEKRSNKDSVDKKWSVIDIERGASLMLFLVLTQAVSVMNFTTFNAISYASSFSVKPEDLNFK